MICVALCHRRKCESSHVLGFRLVSKVPDRSTRDDVAALSNADERTPFLVSELCLHLGPLTIYVGTFSLHSLRF